MNAEYHRNRTIKRTRYRPTSSSHSPGWVDVQALAPAGWCVRCGAEIFREGVCRCKRCGGPGRQME